ncbi:hypothetical protein ACQPW3_36320 [Actinosynnema sp. CA-248983]
MSTPSDTTTAAAVEATHVALADRMRELLFEFSRSGGVIPCVYESDNTHVAESKGFYAAGPYALVKEAFRQSLTHLVGEERTEELYESILESGEDVAWNLRVMREKWANDALNEHVEIADSLMRALLRADKSDVGLVGSYYLTDDRGELSANAHIRAALLKSCLALSGGRLDRAEGLIEAAFVEECDISDLIFRARCEWEREDLKN